LKPKCALEGVEMKKQQIAYFLNIQYSKKFGIANSSTNHSHQHYLDWFQVKTILMRNHTYSWV
jgi:hypothetical protein